MGAIVSDFCSMGNGSITTIFKLRRVRYIKDLTLTGSCHTVLMLSAPDRHFRSDTSHALSPDMIPTEKAPLAFPAYFFR